MRPSSTGSTHYPDMHVEHSELDIKLNRVDRLYRPGDVVSGYCICKARGSWSHQGIYMKVEGYARVETSNRSVSMIDSSYGPMVKPIELIAMEFEIAAAGRIFDGVTEIPFEFRLESAKSLLETYHGVFINVSYIISVDCDRGLIKKSLSREAELIVEVPTSKRPPNVPFQFKITPETLENVRESKRIPKFCITGRLEQLNCPITQPLRGEVVIELAEIPIRSIEIQLVRVESVLNSGNSMREITEIQSLQIGDGDVARGPPIPMYTVFPRLFTCASIQTTKFKVEFEINLIVVFIDDYAVTETFPLTLYRPMT